MNLHRAVPTALLLVALCLHPPAVHAQEPREPWDASLEFGLNGASGNSSFTVLRAGVKVSRNETDLYELDLSGVMRYGTNDDAVIANDAKVSVKFDWRPDGRISPFAFVDASRDKIRRLDFQMDGGAGAKWTVLDRERGEASLSLAALVDYQNFDMEPGSGEPGSESLARWSVRAKGNRTLGEGTKMEHVTFWQPVVNHVHDYVLEITNTLSTHLMEDLSLALEHIYLRDSVPPPGAARDDQKFSILFRLAL